MISCSRSEICNAGDEVGHRKNFDALRIVADRAETRTETVQWFDPEVWNWNLLEDTTQKKVGLVCKAKQRVQICGGNRLMCIKNSELNDYFYITSFHWFAHWSNCNSWRKRKSQHEQQIFLFHQSFTFLKQLWYYPFFLQI